MTAYEERETKIRTSADLERDALDRAGARLERARSFERNWVLDTPDLQLRSAGILLRVRSDDSRWTLTLKEPGHVEGGHKIRPEHETEMQDGEALMQLLKLLGYETVWRYEKYRSHYELNGVKIALDETPIGDFMELEGLAGATEEVAALLGHNPTEFLDLSYASLFRQAGGTGVNLDFARPC